MQDLLGCNSLFEYRVHEMSHVIVLSPTWENNYFPEGHEQAQWIMDKKASWTDRFILNKQNQNAEVSAH